MYFMQEPALYPVVKITFLSAAASGSLLKCLFLTLQNKKIVPLWGLFQLHMYMEYRACFCYCNLFPRVCIFDKICFQLAKRELKCNFFSFFVCTAKRILGIQTSSSFVKIWQVSITEFKAKLLFFWFYMACFFFWKLLEFV